MADIYTAAVIDLSNLDLQLVTDLYDILYVLYAAFRQLGYVAETFTARQQFDKSTEFHETGDTAGVDLAGLYLMYDILDHLFSLGHAGSIARGQEYVAILVNVDLDAGLLGDALDDLAALADDIADLIDLYLDRLDARCIWRQLFVRLGDALEHLAEDEGAAALGLLEGGGQDLAGEAVDCIGLPHVVGSIAGDNTLLLVVDKEEHVEEILSIFNDMLIMKNKK